MTYAIQSFYRCSSYNGPRRDPEIRLKHHLKKVLAFLEPKDMLPSCAGVNRSWHRHCKDEALARTLFLRIFPNLAPRVRLEDIRLFFRHLGPECRPTDPVPEGFNLDFRYPYPDWNCAYQCVRHHTDPKDAFATRTVTTRDSGMGWQACSEHYARDTQFVAPYLSIVERVVREIQLLSWKRKARSDRQHIESIKIFGSGSEEQNQQLVQDVNFYLTRRVMSWGIVGVANEAFFENGKKITVRSVLNDRERIVAIQSAFGDQINRLAKQRETAQTNQKPFTGTCIWLDDLIRYQLVPLSNYPEWVNFMRTCKRFNRLIKSVELAALRRAFPTLMPGATLEQVKHTLNNRNARWYIGHCLNTITQLLLERCKDETIASGFGQWALKRRPEKYMKQIMKRDGLWSDGAEDWVAYNALQYFKKYPQVTSSHRAEALRYALGDEITHVVEQIKRNASKTVKPITDMPFLAAYCTLFVLGAGAFVMRRI
jgi:hypothetical protein